MPQVSRFFAKDEIVYLQEFVCRHQDFKTSYLSPIDSFYGLWKQIQYAMARTGYFLIQGFNDIYNGFRACFSGLYYVALNQMENAAKQLKDGGLTLCAGLLKWSFTALSFISSIIQVACTLLVSVTVGMFNMAKSLVSSKIDSPKKDMRGLSREINELNLTISRIMRERDSISTGINEQFLEINTWNRSRAPYIPHKMSQLREMNIRLSEQYTAFANLFSAYPEITMGACPNASELEEYANALEEHHTLVTTAAQSLMDALNDYQRNLNNSVENVKRVSL